MSDWIGAVYESDVGWDHLVALVDVGNRMTGSPGERRGLELTRDALASAGAREARIDDFEIQGWVRGDSALRAGQTTQDCIALPRSPDASATGELADVGHGLPEDFEDALDGAVVLADSTVPDYYDRFVHRREKYARAVEAGAAAFVFANHAPGCLAPTGGVGTADAPLGEIPAVGVSREVGARLARRFAGEDVTVSVSAETPAATSGNVRAELGPETDDRVLVTSHVDAHDIAEGAVDNAAGTAMVVELARSLADREAELDRRVEFVGFGAEEVGLVGSGRAAERVDPDRVAAVVNLDGVVKGRTLKAYAHGSADLVAAVEAVCERLHHPATVTPDHNPHSDHWPFVARGIPGLMVASETGERGRGWAHTAADTLDKLDRRNFREQAIVLAELVVAVAGRDVAGPSPTTVAAALEDQGEATGLKLVGDWPH